MTGKARLSPDFKTEMVADETCTVHTEVVCVCLPSDQL